MIFGVSMMKDEADICGITVQHLIDEGVEQFLILDNGSTDDTRKILDQFSQVTVANDPERGYYQSLKMSMLAEDARCLGATWIVPFDADEIWIHPGGDTIAEALDSYDEKVIWAYTYEHPPITKPLSLYRALEPKRHRKVAFRATSGVTVAQGNHDVSLKGPRADGLEIREFQYRTFEQFKRKVRNGKAAYDATNLPAGEGAHWRTFGAMTDCELVDAWETMTTRTDVVLDPAPIR